MFCDCNIAKKLAFDRLKVAVIIKYLASEISDSVATRMRNNPFTLKTDSNHDGRTGQFYLILVRTFDNNSVRHTVTDLLTLKSVGASVGENTLNVLKDKLEARSISWHNCTGFSCDYTDHQELISVILRGSRGRTFAFYFTYNIEINPSSSSKKIIPIVQVFGEILEHFRNVMVI